MSSISRASYPIPDPPGSPALQEAWRSNGQCQMLLTFFRISYFFYFSFYAADVPWFYMGSAALLLLRGISMAQRYKDEL